MKLSAPMLKKLSELSIDAVKDWAGMRIDNVGAPNTDDDVPRARASDILSGRLLLARMPAGTAGLVFTGQGAAADPAYAAVSAGLAIFGDGSDGNVTIAAATTLTRDMFYNNLTVNATFTLNTAGYRVFVKGTLTNNGTIRRTPNAGAAGVGGAGLAAGSLGGSFAGANKVNTGAGAGGGGGGPVFISARVIANAGVIAAIGGAGENAPGSAFFSALGGAGTNATTSLGGAGGVGGNPSTGNPGGVGGTVTAPVAGAGGFKALPLAVELRAISTTPTVILVTGGGGGGSGGTYDGDGSAGGGGGGGGGVLVLIYNAYSGAGTKGAPGGAGGTSIGGGAAGATGPSGTVIEIPNA